MHLRRFPNSGIRAKVFVQKIDFKLHVMRLNHIELFYVLVATIGSESRRCLRGRGDHMHAVYLQRWLATVAAVQRLAFELMLATMKYPSRLRLDDAFITAPWQVAVVRKGQRWRWRNEVGAWRLQRDPRCRGGRSRRMVMRRSDGTDDDEINNHRA
ncbi:hypothetical protein B296_00007254 [Ensete ventricosum]|uniref:Uncharacterized protein n=1 Tax=Ensete ventricosum TaxID=4639 RepID=A0A427AJY5_ENSVE|nr:hypothetical protein B296_00007254 [Ensete ventricosum]